MIAEYLRSVLYKGFNFPTFASHMKKTHPAFFDANVRLQYLNVESIILKHGRAAGYHKRLAVGSMF
jgi:hypothetical protein